MHTPRTIDDPQERLSDLPLSLETRPMEARLVEELPHDSGWQFEPKWDGFRCLAFRAANEIDLRAKSGKPLARYFPEVVERLRAIRPGRFVVDGELAIPLGETLSFDALQMRLHPAESRVRKLAAETPAILILFDCLMTPGGETLIDEPLTRRRAALEKFHASLPADAGLRLSPYTPERVEAERWLERAGGALDGIIGKRLDSPYEPGERSMVKVKLMRTADCVIGGFRYEQKSRHVGSLLLGLYNEAGLLDHVGFTATIRNDQRAEVTEQLEALIEPPGFTGNAPGGPSRWSNERSGDWQPLKPILVVEVRYDHVTGGRFRHGTKLIRFRPDKAPEQCTFEQLGAEARPSVLISRILEGE